MDIRPLKNAMMANKDLSVAMGTASGTFLSSFAALQMEDILISALLAIIGAIISFIMSLALDLFFGKGIGKAIRRKRKGKK